MAQYIIESQESIVMNGVAGTIFHVLFECDNGYSEPGVYFVANAQSQEAVLEGGLNAVANGSPNAQEPVWQDPQ